MSSDMSCMGRIRSEVTENPKENCLLSKTIRGSREQWQAINNVIVDTGKCT